MSIDLTTKYLGLELKNPLVASASPLTGSVESLLRLQEAGVSAVVLPSLFEEQIEHNQNQVHQLYNYQADSFAEALSYFPELGLDDSDPAKHIGRVAEAKQQLEIPVIASLNGHTDGGWARYSKWMEDNGADALELNIYFVPTDCEMSGEDVARRYEDLVGSVRNAVSIPLAVKIGSQFTSIPSMVRRLMLAGADGVVLFNRFLEPDLDLTTLKYQPDLVLSAEHEMRLPLRWIAILRDQLTLSLAATSGVHHAHDLAKLILAGADVAMVATTLLRRGVGYATVMLDELRTLFEEYEFESVSQVKGSMSMANCPDPSTLGRANYMQALIDYTADFNRA
ncbi:Dihydroorotate dehydrogenase B (NAD(+)), catalytic subunit [Posidoniimonas polymericola]|uniref:Dihydroorotate dehydrogenase B (NAD(+)), catalytic subunit n=1 Tax=Posidoniimonas polymericola TaxID=2528002 RepID=A0A5C5YLA9_9BACT|nr:dihydroorotate dehydrogenase-like protein [Posidoniimonas polymericola]TWT75662.1 Dihydroorotate dehydrogenase B (NAD(+)), catalytic subunit [Posidoniimonas polymericola]